MNFYSRRGFLKTSMVAGASLFALPTLLPTSLFGKVSSGKRIQVAQIGCGRMGRGDMGKILAAPMARVVAVCDLDSKRLAAAKVAVEEFYKGQGESVVDVKTYADYHQVLADPAIDAVVVSTPDHWHALVATAAALAGKHIYCQKPVTYNIAEAIALRTAVRAKKVILQTGSQQRSEKPYAAFRAASEAVRNGRIGKLKSIQVGIGLDKPSGKAPAPMPIPANLDFERWLGPAPEQPYMEGRVHSQSSHSARPGWITTEDFGLGMITNWGAHHIDIAHWAMGQELGGPSTIKGSVTFMTHDVWTVHQTYHVEMLYPGEVQLILDNHFENGLRFEGTEGWVFCARSAEKVTASDPNVADEPKRSLRASQPSVLLPLGKDATRWPASPDHYLNWLESIAANRDPIAPIDQSARSLEACYAAWLSMKLGRQLTWNPATEKFLNDDAANALLGRKARKPDYDIALLMKKAGLA